MHRYFKVEEQWTKFEKEGKEKHKMKPYELAT